MAIKEVLYKRTLYFLSFLSKATFNQRTVGSYPRLISISLRHERGRRQKIQ